MNHTSDSHLWFKKAIEGKLKYMQRYWFFKVIEDSDTEQPPKVELLFDVDGHKTSRLFPPDGIPTEERWANWFTLMKR